MKNAVPNALSQTEKAQLTRHEAVIERGITSFVEVGKALTQIRDGKLYRASHRTFDAYCKDRWEIGRSRAYELIDQAKVTSALARAGVNLSGTPDISGRDARALKDDPGAVEQVKARVSAGEQAAVAVKAVVAGKKAERDAEQAEHDRHQDQTRAALPPHIQQAEEVKARNGSSHAAIPTRSALSHAIEDAIVAQREELLEENAALKADIAERDARLALFDGMAVQWEKGGFEAVIATKDEQIRVLRRQVEDESADKATWAKRAEFWKKQALALGYVPSQSQIVADDVGKDPAATIDVAELAPF